MYLLRLSRVFVIDLPCFRLVRQRILSLNLFRLLGCTLIPAFPFVVLREKRRNLSFIGLPMQLFSLLTLSLSFPSRYDTQLAITLWAALRLLTYMLQSSAYLTNL